MLLPVRGRAPKTNYARAQFGADWFDADRNGCDTRNDVLARDLRQIAYSPGTGNCVVKGGVLSDPYSGTTIRFQRGSSTSNAVQIDHMVALEDAWQKGAQSWSAERRVHLANDPLNLLAVKGSLNLQKGSGDTATWLPPNTTYRCAYVARQVAVKRSYNLWVTAAEREAMIRVLGACPALSLPTAKPFAPRPPVPSSARIQSPRLVSPPKVTPSHKAPDRQPAAPSAAYYRNCAAAWAAGAATLYRGDPGYRAGLDRDGDGRACEQRP
ncbi:DUF1524 domain-containing protein [Terrabacter koreensis]